MTHDDASEAAIDITGTEREIFFNPSHAIVIIMTSTLSFFIIIIINMLIVQYPM